MHLDDIEAAITQAHGSVRDALAKLAEVKGTIAEEDHKIEVRKQLEANNQMVLMANRIEELEAQLEE